MEPVTLVLAADRLALAPVRDALARIGAVLWSSGSVLATRLGRQKVQELIRDVRQAPEIAVYERELPPDVLEKLPKNVRFFVQTQLERAPTKTASVNRGLAWDAPGREAPRYLVGDRVDKKP